jgi:hypothetical protein
MGTVAETAIVDYRFFLAPKENKFPYSASICRVQTEDAVFH